MLSRQIFSKTVRFASSMAKIDLSGIFPPIATPFDSAGELDLGKLKENFQKWSTKGFRGYVVMGSNGEFPFLSEWEQLALVRAAREVTPKSQLLIVGAGCESTRATIENCAKLSEMGVDAVLVHTPCFYKGRMNDAALQSHYKQVAKASAVPVILYNVTANTGVEMTAEIAIKLADEDNIIGLKDSGGDVAKLAKIVEETKDKNFQVLAGSAGFLLPAFQIGCVGGVLASANVLGAEMVQLETHFKEENWRAARTLQARVVAPNAGITRKYGVAGLKHMMDLLGYYGGPVRSPLQPLTKAEAEDVENIFRIAGFLP